MTLTRTTYRATARPISRRAISSRAGCTRSARASCCRPAPVFDAFGSLMSEMYVNSVGGFAPLKSLDDVGQFALVRMEFLKRLCTAKYGVFNPETPTPIGGEVFVYGVTRDGAIRRYSKDRGQVKVVAPGRPTA